MKFTYRFDEDTKEYIGKEIAQLDPLETKKRGESVYLLPANSTFVAPTEKREGFAFIWNGSEWKEIEDYRGKEYYPAGSNYYSTPIEMKELGALPEGASLERPEKTEEEIAAETMSNAKSERATFVSRIVVEVDGMKFDGDETSQDRMARSIVALNDGETVQWVLADNTIAQVTKEQLRMALRMSGEAQTAIWANPYL